MKNKSKIFRVILLFILIALPFTAKSQGIKIKSFSLQMEPMTVPMQRVDANGNVCALVKVIIPNAQASFEGSLIGNCDYKTSEYWCYLSPGSKQLKIKYPNCEPLMVNFDNFIGGLASKQIYELHLIIPSHTVELNQKIHTITINVHSSQKYKLLGKSLFERLDDLVVERFNRNGVLLDSFPYSKGTLASIDGMYEFTVGAVIGDKFKVKANGYVEKMISFDEAQKTFDVELYPQTYSLRFQVVDSITKEPLIGASVFRNRRETARGFSQWDNWDNKIERFEWDEGKAANIDGFTETFANLKSTENILCSYVGYKDKAININSIKNLSQSNLVAIELVPYGNEEEIPLTIHIGGMGTNDKGVVKVTNSRTKESITMSQKAHDNIKNIFVRLGDEIVFTRGGFRPVSVKFEYSIPTTIWIAPKKGKKSDIQYLKY